MPRSVVVALVLASSVGSARADDVDDLVAKGQELAKQSEWSQAISTFKQADARRPRALHVCMIALAYTRRELWPQAELFFQRCHARATPFDPLPDWVSDAEIQLGEKLDGARVPAIKIAVRPVDATISVSSFEPDESFTSRTIHLAPGHHTLTITAAGYKPSLQEVTVQPGEQREVDVELAVLPPPPPPPPTDPHPMVRWVLVGAGAAAALGGIAADVFEVQPLRDELARSQPAFERNSHSFDTWQRTTLVLWTGGAIALGIGAYLFYRHRDRGPIVSAALDHAGASITIGWQR